MPPLPAYAQLSDADEAALADLFRAGVPANTLRAWERDLAYIAAWKMAVFGQALIWPETEAVALRFVQDHAVDLTDQPGPAQAAAQALIALGLRVKLSAPAPATLDRRIASWQAFHRLREVPSPFAAPQVAAARQQARRANAQPRKPKSAQPVTRDILEQLLEVCDDGLRGVRDRAILSLAFATGGRKRSEVTGLNLGDIDLGKAAMGEVWVRLVPAKALPADQAPQVPLRGKAARALVDWIEKAEIREGPLFRPISKAERVLKRRLSPAALRVILAARLGQAGLPEDFASPHGLRAGFLTQAALDGAPLGVAMQMSLHRSAAQARKYYAEVEKPPDPPSGAGEA